jgi:hypothetical protein
MFETTFKAIDNVLWKESGCTTELDYTEQTSWLLFLKYLDGLEQDRATEAALEGRKYQFILDEPFRWSVWAAPKDASGQIDHNRAMTGDDLRDFVDRRLFPYLAGFKARASNALPATVSLRQSLVSSDPGHDRAVTNVPFRRTQLSPVLRVAVASLHWQVTP